MSSNSENSTVEREALPQCRRCHKLAMFCICDSIEPIKNRTSLLLLQHPQEQDNALGTARLTALHFQDAVLKIGLSWPSLSRALGRPVHDPSRWAVLYLGSVRVGRFNTDRAIVAIDRNGQMEIDQRGALADIEGVVVLDGTWSQAKALWWRNPWMLKCQRVVLGARWTSRYGQLRKEPRRDGLATIEAAAIMLAGLEGRPDIETTLLASFERMLAKYQDVQARAPELAPKPRGRRNYRRSRA
ncbi:tRNA-uridine aminocarboxypropyltransferase [Nitrobacter sp. Nb-311A]|uniref:tRNA-uridine aminocarboxypropyltransferase n=1 Tax=Nitrobacter sp. Nb-311A TaxID=314253 RepID=UPI0003237C21|nr:tRNA-uridine aminocarboxypropyltransferase [Nitrobacter sp. Nb-311A]